MTKSFICPICGEEFFFISEYYYQDNKGNIKKTYRCPYCHNRLENFDEFWDWLESKKLEEGD